MAEDERPSGNISTTTLHRQSQVSNISDTTDVETQSSTPEDLEKQEHSPLDSRELTQGNQDLDENKLSRSNSKVSTQGNHDLEKQDPKTQNQNGQDVEKQEQNSQPLEQQELEKRDEERHNQVTMTPQSQPLVQVQASQRPEPQQRQVQPQDDEYQHKYEELAQKHPHPTDHLSMTIGPPIILFLDLIVPCIIYYTWYNNAIHRWRQECNIPANVALNDNNNDPTSAQSLCSTPRPEFDKDILGYAVISFGFGELYILIARVWRLFAHQDECAPLLSKSRWELDATSWVYAVAMIIALIPFVTGSTLEIPALYLYGPAFLMAFLGLLMIATLLPIKLPIGINSHPRGTTLRPFIYYAAEDFIAVDGLQDRDFRMRYNARYEQSAGFRRMFVILTLWWIAGVVFYIGCLSAVIWTLEFHYAFGLSLGVLFSYIIIWACSSYVFVKIEMHRERIKFEELGHF